MRIFPSVIAALAASTFAPQNALAQAQDCTMTKEAYGRLAALEEVYGDIASDVDCSAPATEVEDLICNGANLAVVNRFGLLAYVYAYENATGSELPREEATHNAGFLAERSECTDAECLCSAYAEYITGSLGQLQEDWFEQ